MTNPQLKRALLVALSMLFSSFALSTLILALAEENEVGAHVFETKCVMCHGKEGLGDTKAGKMMKTPDITATEWKNGKTVAGLEKTLREGLGKMPKYEGKLSDEEIQAVAEYTVSKFVK